VLRHYPILAGWRGTPLKENWEKGVSGTAQAFLRRKGSDTCVVSEINDLRAP